MKNNSKWVRSLWKVLRGQGYSPAEIRVIIAIAYKQRKAGRALGYADGYTAGHKDGMLAAYTGTEYE